MKRYMKIREYCEESGFSEKTMRRLVHTYKAHRFAHRESENGHFIITVPVFEKMWDTGEFREVLE